MVVEDPTQLQPHQVRLWDVKKLDVGNEVSKYTNMYVYMYSITSTFIFCQKHIVIIMLIKIALVSVICLACGISELNLFRTA